MWVFKNIESWSHHCIQDSSVQSLVRVWLCDPVDCSTPGFPVHHQLTELTPTHVHWVGNAIRFSHPLSSLLLPPSIFPSIRVFFSESVLRIRWPKYWSFSFSISPSNEYSGWFPLEWTGWISLQSKGLSRTLQHHNPKASIPVLSSLYSPTLTSIYDYWNNRSLD